MTDARFSAQDPDVGRIAGDTRASRFRFIIHDLNANYDLNPLIESALQARL